MIGFVHRPLLGTLVEVRVGETDERTAERLDELVVAELTRLERVFSVYDPSSELERWKRGEVDVPGEELSSALATAVDWQERSGGAFHLGSRTITDRWRLAEEEGIVPSDDELAALAADAARPVVEVGTDGVPRAVGDASGVDLNAFVKGWIVDRAVDLAIGAEPGADIVISAGGDLRHRGPTPQTIGIENPLRPYDNEPPIARVEVGNAGLASSGRARRGFRVGDRWFGHVIDPRSARPVDHIASISVIAADAATADVVATIAGVEPPDRAVGRADELGVACLVVSPDGTRRANTRWTTVVRGV